LDLIGLVDSINVSVLAIDSGRKGFATKGKAEEGISELNLTLYLFIKD